MPFVESQRENIDLLLQFWHERFNVDTDEIIDYKKYEEYFFCFSDDETAEDVFLDPIQKFLDNGCLKIDLDLFEAVEKFQFDKVRNLLLQGANPNANLLPIDDKNSDDYFNCLDRIGTECGYLCTCQIFPIIKNDVWCSNYALDAQNIGDLIGWATHEDNVQPT